MSHRLFILPFLTLQLLGAVSATAVQGQVHSANVTIPAGWEETQNWIPVFQAAFGTEISLGTFCTLVAESDFLLVHPEQKAFAFVWGEELESQPQWSREQEQGSISLVSSNALQTVESYPNIDMRNMSQQPMADAKQLSLIIPEQGTILHVLLISPRMNPSLREIPRQILDSWHQSPTSISVPDQPSPSDLLVKGH